MTHQNSWAPESGKERYTSCLSLGGMRVQTAPATFPVGLCMSLLMVGAIWSDQDVTCSSQMDCHFVKFVRASSSAQSPRFDHVLLNGVGSFSLGFKCTHSRSQQKANKVSWLPKINKYQFRSGFRSNFGPCFSSNSWNVHMKRSAGTSSTFTIFLVNASHTCLLIAGLSLTPDRTSPIALGPRYPPMSDIMPPLMDTAMCLSGVLRALDMREDNNCGNMSGILALGTLVWIMRTGMLWIRETNLGRYLSKGKTPDQ